MKSFVVAKVVIVNNRGEMLALRRSKSDVRRPGEWDFPGGHVDAGEDMMQAAYREVREEVGFEVSDLQLAFAMSEIVPEYGAGTWLVFVAHCEGEPSVQISHEHDKYQWMKPDAFLAQIEYERQKKMVQYVSENGLLEPRSTSQKQLS